MMKEGCRQYHKKCRMVAYCSKFNDTDFRLQLTIVCVPKNYFTENFKLNQEHFVCCTGQGNNAVT